MASMTARELVVEPVTGESTAQTAKHPREEAAPAGSSVAIASSRPTETGPHPRARHASHAHLRRVTSTTAAEKASQKTQQKEDAENTQPDHQQGSDPEACMLSPGTLAGGQVPDGSSLNGNAGERSLDDLRRIQESLVEVPRLEGALQSVSDGQTLVAGHQGVEPLAHEQLGKDTVVLGDQ